MGRAHHPSRLWPFGKVEASSVSVHRARTRARTGRFCHERRGRTRTQTSLCLHHPRWCSRRASNLGFPTLRPRTLAQYDEAPGHRPVRFPPVLGGPPPRSCRRGAAPPPADEPPLPKQLALFIPHGPLELPATLVLARLTSVAPSLGVPVPRRAALVRPRLAFDTPLRHSGARIRVSLAPHSAPHPA